MYRKRCGLNYKLTGKPFNIYGNNDLVAVMVNGHSLNPNDHECIEAYQRATMHKKVNTHAKGKKM